MRNSHDVAIIKLNTPFSNSITFLTEKSDRIPKRCVQLYNGDGMAIVQSPEMRSSRSKNIRIQGDEPQKMNIKLLS